MEYKLSKLKDVTTYIARGITPKYTDELSGLSVINQKCIRDYKLLLENARRHDISKKQITSEKNIKKYDILINSTGVGTAGRVAQNFEDIPMTADSHVTIVRPDTNVIDPIYLGYAVKNKQKYIEGLAEGSTGQTEISRQRIGEEVCIKYPDSIEVQKEIANFLLNIDKKISINNKINDNLFKYAINYLNNKKEDTEVPISNFAKIQGGYAFKSKDLIDKKTKNRVIKIKNLRSELNADVINSQFVEDEVIVSLDSKFKLSNGDVTIAMTGAELGKTGFIYGFDNYYLNQRVGVIRGNNKERELYLKIIFLSDEFQTLLNSKGYGSAQPNISSSDIEGILVNDITEVNLKDIYEKLNSVYNRIISNCEENLNLEQLRDTMLPKLMNGEIDLDKIDI